MAEIFFKCGCGLIKGVANKVTPTLATRVVCYCDDCQTFAHTLQHENVVLDAHGGTDIIQLPMSYINITEGTEHIRCLKLTTKGMFRWYAGCCNLPIGFTMSAGVPFVGVIRNFIENPDSHDKYFGPSLGRLQTKFANGELPINKNERSMLSIVFKSLSKLLIWKLKGFSKPSAFFDAKGNPVSQPKILKAI